jgi:para-aminobenzoate synthetase component 1
VAVAGGLVLTGLRDVTHDVGALDTPGHWFVVAEFEADLDTGSGVHCLRFDRCTPGTPAAAARELDPTPGRRGGPRWHGPDANAWTSSLGRTAYQRAVATVRDSIACGDVYQANICRILSAPLPNLATADVLALGARLAARNPAPHAAVIRVPSHGLHVACASPELFLARRGALVTSRPIKGTARTAPALAGKDRAENVMIVDLVRNDLAVVAATGTVQVPALCSVEAHPGLVHLVSTVTGRLRPGVGWRDLLSATMPPGSVSGAPKLSALRLIRALEPVPRGPYCGAIGYVDATHATAGLAVGIRTFWHDTESLHFGTGAGVTWGSEPAAEWNETELKAAHLLRVAAGGEREEARGAGVDQRSAAR